LGRIESHQERTGHRGEVKNSTLILGAFAATFAAASVYLGVQLGDARGQLAELEQYRAADQARIRQLEAEYQGLEAAPEANEDVSPAAPSTGAAALVADRMAALTPPPASGAPPIPATERRGGINDTPAARNNRRLQQEIRIRRRYAEMPAALELDAAQSDKLYDLLSEYRMAEYEGGRPYEGDRLGRESVQNATRQERDAAIEALLGPDKAAQFQSFEKSIPARMQVNRIGESMAAANIPLSEAQRKSLITAVMAEQDVVPPPERAPDGSRDPAYTARFLDWQMDYSRRVQARVEPLLDAEQARQYREVVQVQNARRAEMRARADVRGDEAPR
jgi:hypothetical protein